MNYGIIIIDKKNTNDKIYTIRIYLKRDNIIFELENLEKKYSNSFSLNDLKELLFQTLYSINDAFLNFKNLLCENFSIEEGDSFANYIIHRGGGNIKFNLKEIVKKEIKIIFNTLSDTMKTILNNNELILGIDFGTTYSCSSVVLDDQIIVIANSLGERTTPSFVLFLKDNKIYKICSGELAKLQPSYQKNIIYNIKRLIGKKMDDNELQRMLQNLAFNIKEDEKSKDLKILINDKDYYPEQIVEMILKKIILDSEHYLSILLGKKIEIKNSIITVPVYFNMEQINSILKAAKIIDLEIKQIIDEPAAASLYYFYEKYKNKKDVDKSISVIIIDFGGGTLDITLSNLKQTKEHPDLNIVCSGGDSNFGGEDFDNIIMEHCISSITNEDNNIDKDKKLIQNIRLKRACENAKIRLSKKEETRIFIEEYLPNINIEYILTRKEFEIICNPLFEKFESIINKFLKDNNVDVKNIHEVIPIGGSTFIPKIREILQKIFGKIINYNLNPKETVAKGAAIQGAKLSKIKFWDFCPFLKRINDHEDSSNFIIKLKEKENSLSYIDINLYKDTIKDLIIDAEDWINTFSERKDTDIRLMKEKNKLILEKLGNFICMQIQNEKINNCEQKLILSYIKYYFTKLADFFQDYEDEPFKAKIIQDKIIDYILQEIEYYDSNIIFEIIEDFSGDKEILEICIIRLIKNLYGKFTLISEKKNLRK